MLESVAELRLDLVFCERQKLLADGNLSNGGSRYGSFARAASPE